MYFSEVANSMQEEIDFGLKQNAEFIDGKLLEVLAERSEVFGRLSDSMRYVVEGKGKRIRASVVMWGCEAVCGEVRESAVTAACAIELVHAYSLVHDDLPAMDDDDMRRGRATVHKKYDEATAILAGDGLLTLAFEILAEKIEDSVMGLEMVGALAKAGGISGMVSGQAADLEAEKSACGMEMLEYIHEKKTACMFEGSALLGGLAGGASREQLAGLGRYGIKLGLGFQVADDILDISASSEQLGKTAGKDEKAGKLTYPAMLGLEGSRKLEKQLADEAVGALDVFGEEADNLRKLAYILVNRSK